MAHREDRAYWESGDHETHLKGVPADEVTPTGKYLRKYLPRRLYSLLKGTPRNITKTLFEPIGIDDCRTGLAHLGVWRPVPSKTGRVWELCIQSSQTLHHALALQVRFRSNLQSFCICDL